MSAPGGCTITIASGAPVGTVPSRYILAGNMVRFLISITDITGAAADTTTVDALVGMHYYDEVVLTVVHDATGQYHADWDTTGIDSGTYYCEVAGTGTLLVAGELAITINAPKI